MAYTINRTNGSVLTTVSDGTINNSTSLTLVGKNFTGYGEFLNENFIRLLENFNNDIAPVNPVAGQLWWNNTAARLQVFTGSNGWRTFGAMVVQNTAPANLVVGDSWWDTSFPGGQLKIWNGTQFVTVGPFQAASGPTANSNVAPEAVVDSTGTNRVITRFVLSGNTVAILSGSSTFTPSPAIPGFTTIQPGFNLSNTILGAQYNGIAQNALQLGGVPATDYLRTTGAVSMTGTLAIENDSGLTVGVNRNARMTVDGIDVSFRNLTASGDVNLSINQAGVQRTVINVDGATAAVLPGANNLHDLGSSAMRWREVHAGVFSGTATSARYADLAERYEIDLEQPVGTLVKIGGTKEITQVAEANSSDVFGVISQNPGFLLNQDSGTDDTHPAVALAGRVKVRVIGKVQKGQQLVSAGNGVAAAKTSQTPKEAVVIGRSLVDKHQDHESLVECVVKFSV